MAFEIFVKQLDGCSYVSGSLNCTCASHAMWLYRASQGQIKRTSCSVRTQTGDKVGGTRLEQMHTISLQQGITGGTLWRPGSFVRARDLTIGGRYGWHVNVGYRILSGTQFDCFEGNFKGAHDMYVSGGDRNYARVGDPGADGRRPGIPTGYQNIPWDLLERAAGALPLVTNGPTLAQEYGSGRVFAYLTPADPIPLVRKFTVVIDGNTTDRRTPLYNVPNGVRVGAISDASYIVSRSSVAGLWWYRILSTATGGTTANAGRYFKPNSWMDWEVYP